MRDECICEKLGDSISVPPESNGNPQGGSFEEPYNDEEQPAIDLPEADIVDAEGKPMCQQSLMDVLINAEVLLPQGEDAAFLAKVVRRAVDCDGNKVIMVPIIQIQFSTP